MKKACIIFLLSIIISLTALGFSGVLNAENANEAPMYAMNTQTDGQVTAQADEFLRMHIRADSNEKDAQEVKYAVRDRVVEYLTPLVANYQTKAQAMRGVEEHLEEISAVASDALRDNGFAYGARAELKKENFPTRVYKMRAQKINIFHAPKHEILIKKDVDIKVVNFRYCLPERFNLMSLCQLQQIFIHLYFSHLPPHPA